MPMSAHSTHARGRDVAFFVALMATALALGGALAHALELPNKIGMSREDYFIAQQLYAGWNRLAFLLAIQAAGMLALIVIYWREPCCGRWSWRSRASSRRRPSSGCGPSPRTPRPTTGPRSPRTGRSCGQRGSIRISLARRFRPPRWPRSWWGC